MAPVPALAISNFLRQHDLVQVPWVKSQLRFRSTPARRLEPSHNHGQLQVADFPFAPETLLSFGTPLVIVGGGAVDRALLKSLHAGGAAVVAADGGAADCAAAGIVPVAIIGDLDSVEDVEGWAQKTQVIRLTEQITTDFEKCLYSTRAPVTVALGMTGKRFDHTLAALHAVMRHGAGRHVILVDEVDLALAVTGDFAFTVQPGERVSMHPLERVTFAHSEGLLYPLDGLTLEAGVLTGSSNMAVAGPFSVETAPGEQGMWLLVLARSHLERLMAALSGQA